MKCIRVKCFFSIKICPYLRHDFCREPKTFMNESCAKDRIVKCWSTVLLRLANIRSMTLWTVSSQIRILISDLRHYKIMKNIIAINIIILSEVLFQLDSYEKYVLWKSLIIAIIDLCLISFNWKNNHSWAYMHLHTTNLIRSCFGFSSSRLLQKKPKTLYFSSEYFNRPSCVCRPLFAPLSG